MLMVETNTKIGVRDIKDGDWYWINKAIIKEYTPRIGAIGIAVYNFLACLADNRQTCFPSQKYIAKSLGYSRPTINKAIKVLEKEGLIWIEKRDRYHCVYTLLKVRCKAGETQMSTVGNSDVNQGNTNNNKLTRNNNIDIDNKYFKDFKTHRAFKPESREELLALDLVESLEDPEGLPLYLSYAKKYPEWLLRQVLGEALEIPSDRIKKSRGAVFNYLVKKYTKEAECYDAVKYSNERQY